MDEVEIAVAFDENFLDSILYKLHTEYEYPSYTVEWYLKRKNVLLLCLAGEVYAWEKELLHQETAVDLFMPAKDLFDNILRRLFIPALQKKYCSPIEHIYLTDRHIENYKRKGYVIILFRDAIFGRKNSMASNGFEDQLSNRVAKSIRSLTGKGPKSIKTVLLDDETAVHIVNGIISPYEQKTMINTSLPSLGCIGLAEGNVNAILPFATSNESSDQHLFSRVDLFINNTIANSIRESLYLCYDDVQKKHLQIFIEIDVSKNQLCVLVMGCKLDQAPQRSPNVQL